MSDFELMDLGLAKALTNPMRQRILTLLRTEGEQTSTTLARLLGVTSGATSYNLRVLAQHGLVEESDRPHAGRQRWWRAVRRDLRVPPREERSEELSQTLDHLTQQWLAEDVAAFQRFWEHRGDLGESAEMPFSRGTLVVTTQQLHAFFEEYVQLLKRHQAATSPPAPGARPIHVRFLTFPEVGDETVT